MKLSSQEKQLCRQGYQVIAGVDEAGRGAWAGPLVAAAVAVDQTSFKQNLNWLNLVNDSKALSLRQRENLFGFISQDFVWSVSVVSHKIIDQIGVGEANRQAVKAAVVKLSIKPDYLLVDYVAKLLTPLRGTPFQIVVNGDATVLVIALASIVAKVYRDRLMIKLGRLYPKYGFAQHKGYGTRQHRAMLARWGVSAIHRQSYRPVARYLV